MVKHKKLQSYKRHYGTTCITGMLGCRWHRYQQSTDSTGKVGIAWFCFLIFTTLFTLFMLYYWILAENSSDDFSWYWYGISGKWWSVYTIVFSLTCVIFSYVLLLFLLSLCHIGLGHQIYISWIHRILLLLTVGGCMAVLIVMTDLWREGWKLQYISIMITGPFLHLGMVIVMTSMSWFIAERWMTLDGKYRQNGRVYISTNDDEDSCSKVWRVISISAYVTIMLVLYISPLFITSPCICENKDLPKKPVMFAHRGASAIAPENTLEAFNVSAKYDLVYAFETDITVSYDGVPFLMHDKKLTRTTNVQEVFPDKANNYACMFNMSEIRKLKAGIWFIESDPFGTVSSLTQTEKDKYKELKVPTLTQLLDIVALHNKKLLFDLSPYEYGIPKNHPYAKNFSDVIVDTIVKHKGVKQQNVYWLYKEIFNTTSNNLTTMYGKAETNEDLMQTSNIDANVPFSRATLKSVRDLEHQNISINVWVVNTKWLYSAYWCTGVPSVTTNYVHVFSNMKKPVWHLTPSAFRMLWIITDVISVILIFTVFIVQRLRKGIPKKYTPEVVTLQTAKQHIQNKRYNRYMKEKLIMAGEGLQEVETEQGIVGISDVENPDSDSLNRYSYCSSIAEPFDNRISGVSHLSNVSGISAVSSGAASINGSIGGTSLDQNKTGYGTIVINESNGERSEVHVNNVHVEIT